MVIFHRYVTYVSLPEGNSTTSKGRKTGFWGCRLKTKLSWNVSGETTFKATVFLLCNLVLPRDAGTWHVSHHFERTSSCTVTTPLWNRITKRTYHTHTHIYIYVIYSYVAIHHQSVIPPRSSPLLGVFPHGVRNGAHPLLHLTRLDAFCSPTELSQKM